MPDLSALAHTIAAAECTPTGHCHFGDPDREAARALAGTALVPLTHLALIEVAGPDAAAFLQGQLSNDVRKVTPELAQLSSLNSAKGRLLAVLHVLRAGDAFLLEVHRSLLEPLLRRLQQYVLRSKVTLRESPYVLFGLVGPEANRALAKVRLPQPEAPLACAWKRDRAVLRRLGAAARWSIALPVGDAGKLWQSLAKQAEPAGTRGWQLHDVLGGIPVIYPQTQERFVAQMCNLDALGAISFDKGCYTGQEVVARVHYRGAVKRHMSVIRTPEMGLAPGATLALAGGTKGEVVDALAHPDGGTVALVVASDPGPEPAANPSA